MEKIRFLKSEITQKCTYLKTLRVNQAQENGEEKRYKPKVKTISGVGVALTELKRGTEVLKREVTKKKTEMDLIDKYLNEK
jgi:transposase